MRISDILKRAKEKKEKAKIKEISHEASKERLQSEPTIPHLPQEKEAKPKHTASLFKDKHTSDKIEDESKPKTGIYQSIKEKSKLISKEEALQLYGETLNVIKDIYEKIKTTDKIFAERANVSIYVEKFVNQQSLTNESILSLLNLPIKDDYVYSHVVNVCIISLEIGLGLGYERSKLIELGTAAILHDVGLMKLSQIYSQPRRLSIKEYDEIKTHSRRGVELVEKFKDIYKKTIPTIHQVHERADGSGYPNGLKEDSIDEDAQIIGVADIYEATTHSRPYRGRYCPVDALKEIVNAKSLFKRKLIKILIERINCPYTVGTNVRLSSGEKGKIVKRNIGVPLRPVVEVTHDALKNKLEKTKIINLNQHPTVYTKECLCKK